MAEAVLSNLAIKIIEGLGSLLVQEIGLASGVKKDLRKLEDSLSKIKAILLDAEKKAAMNDVVKDWLRKLKDIAYDSEDVLDEFATEALRQKVELPNNVVLKQVHRCFSRLNPLIFRLKMADRIKDIIERLDRVQKDDQLAEFQFRNQSVDWDINDNDRRYTVPSVIESEVLGREGDRENLVELLTSGASQENVLVIPIIGIGGLGKTTLAQYVYNDERIKNHFELQMWVCVSFDFDAVHLAKKILQSLTDNKCGDLGENQAKSELMGKLSGKRYLLVLDDIWNEYPGKWENLRNLLIVGGIGSMILVTTRNKKVASIMHPIKVFYHLKELNENDCESLFNERAFGRKGREANHPELVEIGKAIVKKCGGVPLAAKALGSLLCLERNKKDWLDVLHTEIWNLGEREILPALRISFNQLPSHLQQCFAYCSLFPQDHEIDVDDLISQWMAHGFIQPPPRGSYLMFEDIGNRYFRELLWRSFFQEVREDAFGNIKGCKMHDLVHNLARWVAGIEWSEVDSGNGLVSVSQGARHMVFHGKAHDALDRQNLIHLDKAQNLRTICLQGGYGLQISAGFISSLRGLRVLKLRGLGIRHVPSSIGCLQQLRYLDLSWNEFQALPNSICRLYNLQTLRLEGCYVFNEWPRDMTKMVSLRHLGLQDNHSMEYMPRGLGQLASLQTLTNFLVGNPNKTRRKRLLKMAGGLGELHGLNQLRGRLCIEGLGNVRDAKDAEESKLKEKSELQSLILNWRSKSLARRYSPPVEDEQVLDNLQPHPNLKVLTIHSYEGVKMPRWMIVSSSLLSKLLEVNIERCYNLKSLPLIGEFPCLRRFRLNILEELESICNKVVVRDNKGEGERNPLVLFPFLEQLKLESLPILERWTISVAEEEETESSEGVKMPRLMIISSFQLPNLVELYVERCSNIINLPLIGEFPCLRRLYLSQLDALESIHNKVVGSGNGNKEGGGKGKPLVLFPVLEQLTLWKLPNLERWTIYSIEAATMAELWEEEEKEESVEETQHNHLLLLSSLFPRLTDLKLSLCPKLTTVPMLSVGGIQHLTSLRNLHIEGLERLVSLPDFPAPTTLERLHMKYCPNLTTLTDCFFENLKLLSEFKIWACTELTSLPEGIQHLTALKRLNIQQCSKLLSLPEGIQHLTRLEELKIINCPGLAAVPAGLRNLQLSVLEISDCPNLSSDGFPEVSS